MQWLGFRASHVMNAVTKDNQPAVRIEDARTSEEHYRIGVWLLRQDHHADGPFLHAGCDAFHRAHQAAIAEEEGNPDFDPKTRDALFYKFLAENFAGVLKRIVHDNHWNNY